MTVVNWANAFAEPKHKQIIIDALKYCIKEKGLNIYAWCLMPNHIHLVVNTNPLFALKDTIRDFKKFTANKIIESYLNNTDNGSKMMLNVFQSAANKSSKHKNFKLWQVGNHAIELYSEKFIWQKINYIHNNPVKAGLVDKSIDWKYSSAGNYFGKSSVIDEVICLTPRLITY